MKRRVWNACFKLPIPSNRSQCLKHHSASYVGINVNLAGAWKVKQIAGYGNFPHPLFTPEGWTASERQPERLMLTCASSSFVGYCVCLSGESYVTCKMLKLLCCEQIPTPIATLTWSDTICNIGTWKWCQRREKYCNPVGFRVPVVCDLGGTPVSWGSDSSIAPDSFAHQIVSTWWCNSSFLFGVRSGNLNWMLNRQRDVMLEVKLGYQPFCWRDFGSLHKYPGWKMMETIHGYSSKWEDKAWYFERIAWNWCPRRLAREFVSFCNFSISWENDHVKCKWHFWGPSGSKAVVMSCMVFDPTKPKEAPLSGFAMLSWGVCSSSVVTWFYPPILWLRWQHP